jgi:hypothetical protein
MVNVMTTYLPSSLVEHADGKLLSTSPEPKPVNPGIDLVLRSEAKTHL